MMELRLIRTDLTSDGVFGRLLTPGHIPLMTGEDDWLDNQPRVSCIPAGTYTLRRTMFFKHGYECFEVTGVPGRSRILIHVGNSENDVEGCIMVGLSRGYLPVARDEDTGRPNAKKRAVLGSKVAFAMFMQWMTGIDEATLVVEWMPGLLPSAQAA
jgi:hypothetical protein